MPEWDEYSDTLSGRKFYVNSHTGEKSWKPPRKPKGSSGHGSGQENSSHEEDEEDLDEDEFSPLGGSQDEGAKDGDDDDDEDEQIEVS